ncbi:beta-glucosidase 12-like isoform X1 [Diospyros lotus]|uniref:beta-glucosidase 12-like isoform X1 n=1 Tax=Diospyros lotus TaxID=55363 RepID=UPI002256B780|nr:beta-glucosidase 12-like isoform X1 [Diospyros lotus]
MAKQSFLLLSLLVVAASLALTEPVTAADRAVPQEFNRTNFPKGFVFGASSAAYQYEGAPKLRGKVIWDAFIRDFPYKIEDRSNATVANGFYYLFRKDIQTMKMMGLDVFRFSISWARVLPYGKVSGGVNKIGVAFYNALIDQLLANGIKPFVTLHHFDTPQALEKKYESFLNDEIVIDYADYAEFCFKTFGDRVKNWITFNEPNVFIPQGYDLGTLAPGRCSKWRNNNCTVGNSATEPYIVGYHLLLSHAEAVKRYKTKYQASQKGQIGITLIAGGMYPQSNKDKIAAKRVQDFMFGWFIHPVVYGDYPRIMKTLVRRRLPKFNSTQSESLKGSYDFIGLNYYSSYYVINIPFSNKPAHLSYSSDYYGNLSTEKNGVPIGPTEGTLFSVPKGFTDILVYVKKYYKNPKIYITENGTGQLNNQTAAEGVKDPYRIRYYYQHLSALEKAIKEGVNVKGYMAWSFLDDFEWSSGYTVRYGLNYVDYGDGLKRYPKDSACWYKNFLLSSGKMLRC